jgi:hypothetical protein
MHHAKEDQDMLRKLLLGVSAATALGAVAVSASPASAQVVSFSFGTPGYDRHGFAPAYYGYGPGWRGGYYGRPHYGYGRPHWGPRCFYRPVRYWDGWGWVVRERRICR